MSEVYEKTIQDKLGVYDNLHYSLEDFYVWIQELWETEGNNTQFDEDLTEFFHRFYTKLINGDIEVEN